MAKENFLMQSSTGSGFLIHKVDLFTLKKMKKH